MRSFPKTFFTSDLHFGHENILKYRNIPGVDTVDQHNEFLIHKWNDVVTDDDTVIILGDFAMGVRTETVPLAKRLKGKRKLLLPGNHDYVWRGEEHSRNHKWEALYKDSGLMLFGSGNPQYWGPVGGESRFVLHHFPWKGHGAARHDDKYDDFMLDPDSLFHKNRWLLHGHVHDAWWVETPRMINVGVDVWGFAPAHLDQILHLVEIMSDAENTVAIDRGVGILPS